MKTKLKIKMCIDLIMTVLLLLLMAFQVTGDKLHEWFGTVSLALFILHNILNIKWYGNLFKGKYTPLRIFQTAVNIAVLGAMLCLGFSGVVMSHHVFAALPIKGPMATARSMHLADSYWGFVLMSVHLGIHWGMITGIFKKILKVRKIPEAAIWTVRAIAFAIAAYGIICFIRADIFSYMFLKNQFAFFDFEKKAAIVFAEYATMMSFWIFAGYYSVKLIKKIFSRKTESINEVR